MSDSTKNKKKHLRWLLPLLLLAALLLSYLTWWQLPLENAYDFELRNKDILLTIEDGVYGEADLTYEQKPRSSFLAARARKAAKAVPLQWTSSDPRVAQVDESGRVRAVEQGEALISGRWGALEQSCLVKVYYPLKGIALSEENLTIIKGEELVLKAGPLPAQAKIEGEIRFHSENPEVAEVDEKGLVRAKTPGSATLVVSSQGLESRCQVSVLSPMTGLALDVKSETVNAGDKFSLNLHFLPEDTTDDKSVVWSSSREGVASVSQDGAAEAFSPGRTRITAQAGEFSASAWITVLAPLKGLSLQEESLELLRGSMHLLRLIPEPENTTDRFFPVYESSHPDIVSVSQNGRLRALAPGESTITVRYGGFSASCRVSVQVPLESIEIEEEGGPIVRGEEMALTPVFFPEESNTPRDLVWKSSDPSVVEVSDAGRIRALSPGRAEIMLQCGEVTSSIAFDVIVPVSGLEIAVSERELNRGESVPMEVRLLPEDTTEEKDIYYESTNPAVAGVDAEGNLVAYGPGECVITARHGEFSASCRVQVKVPLKGISLEPASFSLLQGSSGSLQAIFDPWDTTDSRQISWSSSDPSIAAVDETGHVRALAPGDVWISAAAAGFSAGAQLHVEPYIPVAGVSLSAVDISFYYYDESYKMEAWVEPSYATHPQVSWSSSDPSIVYVDADGRLYAKGSGTAWITAKAEDKTATCVVYVHLPPPPKVVVIDAGHGGIFEGAVFGGRYERQMNLTTAYACKNYLEANYSGVKVYMTRTGDVALADDVSADIFNRAAYANRIGADLLVSLHYNASLNHDASGVAVYASFDPRVGDESQALASVIVNQLAAYTGLENGGVRLRYYDETGRDKGQGDYYGIIRYSAGYGIPAVLVEHCHMDYDIWCVDSEEDLVQFGIQDAIAIARYLGLSHK